ncbi:MAG: hypothetical protein JW841_15625 [Deltaproteobacteria bacterium]|nr:hypothetical protein [Deltaproteobacteria bacterium]
MTEVNGNYSSTTYDPSQYYNDTEGVCSQTPLNYTPAPDYSSNVCTSTTEGSTTTDNNADRREDPPAVARSTFNNAARTSSNPTPEPYADAGVTSTGDGVFAGAAAIKGRDQRTGIETEVFTISGRLGGENEVQAGMGRIGVSSDDGMNNATMEVFTARAAGGAHNNDGSTGINAELMGTVIGAQGTASYEGNSITGGLSFSAGAGGSIGLRNADQDDSTEVCGSVSVMFFTLGTCIETGLDII